MRPKRCTVEHFGSYESCELDYSNLGLTLVSGSTGSGKSTLSDFPVWALWGITSKNGASDDVRAWGSDEPTKVTLEVELPGGEITVTRIRGKQSQNDLYWVEASDPEKQVRGKDAAETQKLLSKRLGVDADLALLAGWFTQFAETDRFFTCKPKERREVLERITDLSLAVTLGERASEARKLAKAELAALESTLSRETGRQEQMQSQRLSLNAARASWEQEQARQKAEAEAKAANFESEKLSKIDSMAQELEDLAGKIQGPAVFEVKTVKLRQEQEKLVKVRANHQQQLSKVAELKANLSLAEKEYRKQESQPDTCPTCRRPGAAPNRGKCLAEAKLNIGALTDALGAANAELASLQKALEGDYSLQRALADIQRAQAENERLQDRLSAQEAALIALDEQVNPYMDRVERLKLAKNPYGGQAAEAEKALAAMAETLKGLEQERADKEHRVASLSSIYDLSFALRGELLQSAVSQLERETNGNLTEYFDGVFAISLMLEGSDKLQVTVSKEGHEVAYAQLSGGERRQMVLSFWRALSKRAWECAGVTSSLVVMDEAFSGLDDALKEKAFRMLQDMSDDFESILVIDHSPAFQVNFDRVIEVTKQGEESMISLEREGIQEAA